MNIVLCGMMGAGKTSVGRKLQFLTGRQCVDTDDIIVEKYGKISDIFENYGEAYFRNLETQTAEILAGKDNLIVSTGGGFVLREENVNFLKRNGKIFYLRARLSTLVERVGDGDSRPLLRDGAEKKLAQLMVTRAPVYERVADYIVDTDGKTVTGVAQEILRHSD